MNTVKGTRTLTIGELSVKLKSSDLAAMVIDTAVACDFEVEVEFDYSPGWSDPRMGGAMEDGEPPIDPELTITAIKASDNVHFDGEHATTVLKHGTDLMPLFTGAQVTALEDQIYKAIQAGGWDDA